MLFKWLRSISHALCPSPLQSLVSISTLRRSPDTARGRPGVRTSPRLSRSVSSQHFEQLGLLRKAKALETLLPDWEVVVVVKELQMGQRFVHPSQLTRKARIRREVTKKIRTAENLKILGCEALGVRIGAKKWPAKKFSRVGL